MGDLVDYGPHSNEVISFLKKIPFPVICNIWGNHEKAAEDAAELSRFSSERGKKSSFLTKKNLSFSSKKFIREKMDASGKKEFFVKTNFGEKKFLAVHASLEDVFWKSVTEKTQPAPYAAYDFVLSGHSHVPHYFEKFVPCENEKNRFKKKIAFLNPGSVGQPRNLCPFSQFALFDGKTEGVEFVRLPYDIKREQKAFCAFKNDEFYKTRLALGV